METQTKPIRVGRGGFRYKEVHLNWLKENVPLYSWKEIAPRFNKYFGTAIKFGALRQACNKRKINRPLENQHFQKGLVPWNKGVTGYMGANATSFKKGQRPSNWKPVGSMRLNCEGYVEIKTAEPGKWEYRSRLVLQENGIIIPKNHVAFHKNGIPDDDRLENLIVIPRTILARIGHCSSVYGVPYKQLPEDLQKAVFLQAQLTVRIKQGRKNVNSDQ